MLLISQIELPKDQDREAFGAFMRDEYLPAVHTGPTRVGQVEALELVERDGEEFLLLVHFNGPDTGKAVPTGFDDAAVPEKFDRFGARIAHQVAWNEVARR
jgi:hypothetical protein